MASSFGFYLRKKEYAKAEEYLQYFSDNDPMKKIYQGRLCKEKGENEAAYKMFENVIFSGYQTLNLTFSLMKEKLLDGFSDKESFGYMRGNKAWEELINDKTH